MNFMLVNFIIEHILIKPFELFFILAYSSGFLKIFRTKSDFDNKIVCAAGLESFPKDKFKEIDFILKNTKVRKPEKSQFSVIIHGYSILALSCESNNTFVIYDEIIIQYKVENFILYDCGRTYESYRDEKMISLNYAVIGSYPAENPDL